MKNLFIALSDPDDSSSISKFMGMLDDKQRRSLVERTNAQREKVYERLEYARNYEIPLPTLKNVDDLFSESSRKTQFRRSDPLMNRRQRRAHVRNVRMRSVACADAFDDRQMNTLNKSIDSISTSIDRQSMVLGKPVSGIMDLMETHNAKIELRDRKLLELLKDINDSIGDFGGGKGGGIGLGGILGITAAGMWGLLKTLRYVAAGIAGGVAAGRLPGRNKGGGDAKPGGDEKKPKPKKSRFRDTVDTVKNTAKNAAKNVEGMAVRAGAATKPVLEEADNFAKRMFGTAGPTVGSSTEQSASSVSAAIDAVEVADTTRTAGTVRNKAADAARVAAAARATGAAGEAGFFGSVVHEIIKTWKIRQAQAQAMKPAAKVAEETPFKWVMKELGQRALNSPFTKWVWNKAIPGASIPLLAKDASNVLEWTAEKQHWPFLRLLPSLEHYKKENRLLPKLKGKSLKEMGPVLGRRALENAWPPQNLLGGPKDVVDLTFAGADTVWGKLDEKISPAISDTTSSIWNLIRLQGGMGPLGMGFPKTSDKNEIPGKRRNTYNQNLSDVYRNVHKDEELSSTSIFSRFRKWFSSSSSDVLGGSGSNALVGRQGDDLLDASNVIPFLEGGKGRSEQGINRPDDAIRSFQHYVSDSNTKLSRVFSDSANRNAIEWVKLNRQRLHRNGYSRFRLATHGRSTRISGSEEISEKSMDHFMYNPFMYSQHIFVHNPYYGREPGSHESDGKPHDGKPELPVDPNKAHKDPYGRRLPTVIPHGVVQHGGPITQGLPYLVGEAGPEIFIPRTSGRVDPNAEQWIGERLNTRNTMGGSGNRTLAGGQGDDTVEKEDALAKIKRLDPETYELLGTSDKLMIKYMSGPHEEITTEDIATIKKVIYATQALDVTANAAAAIAEPISTAIGTFLKVRYAKQISKMMEETVKGFFQPIIGIGKGVGKGVSGLAGILGANKLRKYMADAPPESARGRLKKATTRSYVDILGQDKVDDIIKKAPQWQQKFLKHVLHHRPFVDDGLLTRFVKGGGLKKIGKGLLRILPYVSASFVAEDLYIYNKWRGKKMAELEEQGLTPEYIRSLPEKLAQQSSGGGMTGWDRYRMYTSQQENKKEDIVPQIIDLFTQKLIDNQKEIENRSSGTPGLKNMRNKLLDAFSSPSDIMGGSGFDTLAGGQDGDDLFGITKSKQMEGVTNQFFKDFTIAWKNMRNSRKLSPSLFEIALKFLGMPSLSSMPESQKEMYSYMIKEIAKQRGIPESDIPEEPGLFSKLVNFFPDWSEGLQSSLIKIIGNNYDVLMRNPHRRKKLEKLRKKFPEFMKRADKYREEVERREKKRRETHGEGINIDHIYTDEEMKFLKQEHIKQMEIEGTDWPTGNSQGNRIWKERIRGEIKRAVDNYKKDADTLSSIGGLQVASAGDLTGILGGSGSDTLAGGQDGDLLAGDIRKPTYEENLERANLAWITLPKIRQQIKATTDPKHKAFLKDVWKRNKERWLELERIKKVYEESRPPLDTGYRDYEGVFMDMGGLDAIFRKDFPPGTNVLEKLKRKRRNRMPPLTLDDHWNNVVRTRISIRDYEEGIQEESAKKDKEIGLINFWKEQIIREKERLSEREKTYRDARPKPSGFMQFPEPSNYWSESNLYTSPKHRKSSPPTESRSVPPVSTEEQRRLKKKIENVIIPDLRNKLAATKDPDTKAVLKRRLKGYIKRWRFYKKKVEDHDSVIQGGSGEDTLEGGAGDDNIAGFIDRIGQSAKSVGDSFMGTGVGQKLKSMWRDTDVESVKDMLGGSYDTVMEKAQNIDVNKIANKSLQVIGDSYSGASEFLSTLAPKSSSSNIYTSSQNIAPAPPEKYVFDKQPSYTRTFRPPAKKQFVGKTKIRSTSVPDNYRAPPTGGWGTENILGTPASGVPPKSPATASAGSRKPGVSASKNPDGSTTISRKTWSYERLGDGFSKDFKIEGDPRAIPLPGYFRSELQAPKEGMSKRQRQWRRESNRRSRERRESNALAYLPPMYHAIKNPNLSDADRKEYERKILAWEKIAREAGMTYNEERGRMVEYGGKQEAWIGDNFNNPYSPGYSGQEIPKFNMPSIIPEINEKLDNIEYSVSNDMMPARNLPKPYPTGGVATTEARQNITPVQGTNFQQSPNADVIPPKSEMKQTQARESDSRETNTDSIPSYPDNMKFLYLLMQGEDNMEDMLEG